MKRMLNILADLCLVDNTNQILKEVNEMEIKTLKDLERYVKRNCIKCTKNEYGRKLYKVELEFSEHLQKMDNVWTEYNCCEGTTIGDFYYDIPSWDMGVYGEKGNIYVYCEIKSQDQENF